jgi:hypothetical protein
MNPLILHKENRPSGVAPHRVDSEWVQEVARRCRLAKESLATAPLDSDPRHYLRTLICEDIPALLEKVGGSDGAISKGSSNR